MIRRWQARRNFLEYDFTVYPTVAREASRAAEVVGDDHDEPRGCGFESPHIQSFVLVRSTIRMTIDEPLSLRPLRFSCRWRIRHCQSNRRRKTRLDRQSVGLDQQGWLVVSGDRKSTRL